MAAELLLKEDGDKVLQEDSDTILLESSTSDVPVPQYRKIWAGTGRRIPRDPSEPRRR